ncbi:MAG: hypothetical protein ABIP75_01245 [Pyrinomonadaceae bacterium]
MSSKIRVLILLSLVSCVLAVTIPVSGQRKRPSAMVDTDQLRRDFLAAVGRDFELVKDELKAGPPEIGGLPYWLAYVKPKRQSLFTLKYTYNFRDGSYVRGEGVYDLRVSDPGCPRALLPYTSAGNVCLGDTVIIPIRLHGIFNHKFTLTDAPEAILMDGDPARRLPQGLNRPQPSPASITNPVAPNLKFLGTSRHELLYRNLDVMVVYSAVFQAVEPGRFNLSVRPDPSANPESELGKRIFENELAVIVVALDAPVTFLAEHENTTDHSRFKGVTVGNSNNYQITTQIIQVGDVISVSYASEYVRAKVSRDISETEQSASIRPEIIRGEFKPKTDRYDAWILDQLPR